MHTLFETQYTELALAEGEIAEWIRALDKPALGSYTSFAESTCIEEETGDLRVQEMIRQLVIERRDCRLHRTAGASEKVRPERRAHSQSADSAHARS